MRLRLRTKFLLSMVVVSIALTATSLLVVRRTVEGQVRGQILQDLHNSAVTFRRSQTLREQNVAATTRLMADLPVVRALMTSGDPATIQDASTDVWQLAGTDMMVLASPDGLVMAIHLRTGSAADDVAVQQAMRASLATSLHWWRIGDRLYEVSIQPIYFGTPSDRLLGFVAAGYQIDSEVAHDVSQVAASQVAFCYGSAVVRSTLSPAQEQELTSKLGAPSGEMQLASERFLAESVDLSSGAAPVRLIILKSFDQATAILRRLDQLLLLLGCVAVAAGSLLVFVISRTFTKPLDLLVRGVRALGKGDFDYPLVVHGGDEVAELTSAFGRMRGSLQQTQRQLLEAERLATIGQMASSISHDMRHHLAAVVANSEFLSEGGRETDRQELYDEIRTAVEQMTDLIDSLVEFSRTRESLRRTHTRVREVVDRAVQTVRGHLEFQNADIRVSESGACEGAFDTVRLQRLLQNLLLNACEASVPAQAHVEIRLQREGESLRISVADRGRGIPAELRTRVFEPFVSHGKEYGTGLGLTVVQKIVTDHGGEIAVSENSSGGTIFVITLPVVAAEPHPSAVFQPASPSL